MLEDSRQTEIKRQHLQLVFFHQNSYNLRLGFPTFLSFNIESFLIPNNFLQLLFSICSLLMFRSMFSLVDNKLFEFIHRSLGICLVYFEFACKFVENLNKISYSVFHNFYNIVWRLFVDLYFFNVAFTISFMDF